MPIKINLTETLTYLEQWKSLAQEENLRARETWGQTPWSEKNRIRSAEAERRRARSVRKKSEWAEHVAANSPEGK